MSLENQQHSVGAFGERLRREREMRGVSLDEIAEATKIGTRLLRALEEEQFDLLPGGIFNKGFVRAYAKYLGINEEQAVADYMQAAGESQLDFRLLAQPYQAETNAYADSDGSRDSGFPLIPVVILLVVIGTGFGGWKLYQQHVRDRESLANAESSTPVGNRPEAAVPNQVSPAQEVAKPAPAQQNASQVSGAAVSSLPASAKTSGSTGASVAGQGQQPQPTGVSGAVATKGFEVGVHTTGRAWVSIKVDGNIAVRGIIGPEQPKTLQANREVVVWTGNAGVTEVSFDGKPVPVGGGVNDVKVLVFHPNGLQPEPPPKPQGTVGSTPRSTSEPSPTPQ